MDENYEEEEMYTAEEVAKMREDLGPPEYFPKYNIDGLILSTN